MCGLVRAVIPVPYLNDVAVQAIQNAYKPETIKNTTCIYHLQLDDYTEAKYKEKLGFNCYDDQTEVEIELIARPLQNAWVLNTKHWAWLIKFKDTSKYSYATIEFSSSGLILDIYGNNLSLYQVCTSIIGEENTIFYTEEFATTRRWGEILKQVFNMKEKNFKAKDYGNVANNCRDFARELGLFFTSTFSRSKYYTTGDVYFPNVRTE
jgi:hypothetical protein